VPRLRRDHHPGHGPDPRHLAGADLLKMAVGMWKMNGSCWGTADPLSGLFGMNGCAKSTIQHVRDSVADLLELETVEIAKEMTSKDDPVGID